MYDGYYSFDWGTEKREDFWWYDEFNINLGQPKSTPINVFDSSNGQIQESVWKREFENGIAIVNSTGSRQTIKFDSEYEKIKSNQNPSINNGQKINSITLNSEDGTILLRPINEITESLYTNGSFARIFNQNGENIRSGFFAYNPDFRGGTKISTIDLDGGGRKETITIDDSKIEIISSYGFSKKTFYPYGQSYKSGISIAFADINNDQKLEIITGTKNGGSNEVKIFDNEGNLITSFYAYKKEWINLGVNVAAGDINGDGQIEIITGPSKIGGAHIKIFNYNGTKLISEFFAYDSYIGGSNVAVGDLNNDSIDEIVTGAGPSNEAIVKIFDFKGNLKNKWLAYSSQNKNGIEITISDVDQNGTLEVIALTTNVFTLSSLTQ